MRQNLAPRLLLLSGTFLAVLITGSAGAAQNANQRSQPERHNHPEFFSFDYPGADNTQATAITPSATSSAATRMPTESSTAFYVDGGSFIPSTFPPPLQRM